MTHTIQQVIDLIGGATAVTPPADTVDVFKCGDPTATVNGIVTTFTATIDVIRKAASLQANLIITHEPTFYNHRDELEWIQNDAVYKAKRELLERTGITVWRFHDTWHMTEPDGILTGVVRQLGWENCVDPQEGYLFHIPPMTARELAGLLKSKMGLSGLRMAGDPEMTCQQVALLLGSVPGEWQVDALRRPGVDAVICGETVEWQACEYVRDASAADMPKAVLAIGHERSEEAGMTYLVEWLSARLPDVPITHLSAGDPLRYL